MKIKLAIVVGLSALALTGCANAPEQAPITGPAIVLDQRAPEAVVHAKAHAISDAAAKAETERVAAEAAAAAKAAKAQAAAEAKAAKARAAKTAKDADPCDRPGMCGDDGEGVPDKKRPKTSGETQWDYLCGGGNGKAPAAGCGGESANGSGRDVSAAALKACREQTGMTNAQCRADAAAGNAS